MSTAKTAAVAPAKKQSRVGKRPVELPKGVTAAIANGKIEIKGPKGSLSRPLVPGADVKIEGGAAGDVMDAAAYETYCEGRAH